MAEQPAATVTLYDREGKAAEVPSGQAAALLRSGQFGLPEGSSIPMQTADGGWEQVDAAQAVQRAQSYTARVGSAQDVHDTQREREFSGLGMKAAAAATGVVDSLGLGFGDAGMVKAAEALGYGDDVRSFIADADRFAPGSRMAGKVGGFLLPAVVTGGASGAASGAGRGLVGGVARAATAPARALAAAAEGAGGLVARGVAEAGAPGVGRFLAPVVSQGLELGVYGAGDAASQAIVRDPGIDGEALAARMGQGFLHGAAFGAGAGAGLGVLSAGAGWAAGKAGAAAGRVTDAAAGWVGRQAERIGGLEAKLGEAAPELAARGADLVGQGLDRATGLAERLTGRTAPGLGEGAGVAARADRLARTVVDVDKASVQKALESTGADARLLSKADRLPPEVRQTIARQVVEELPAALGKEGKVLSHAEQAEAAAVLRQRKGEALGATLDRLDAEGISAGFTPLPAIRAARKEVVEPLRRTAGMGAYAERVEGYLGDLQRIADEAPMSFKEFHGQRAALDDLIYEARASKSPATKALEKVRGILEDSFNASADMAAKRAGSTAAAEYRALKAEYRAAKWVEEATSKGANRSAANRGYGMSEQLGTIAGAVAGGGGLTGMAMGAAGAVVNRAVKQYGDQVSAAILREMAAGKPLAEAVATVSQRNLGEQAKRFADLARGPAKQALDLGKTKARELLSTARTGLETTAAEVRAGARRAGEAVVDGARAVGWVGGRAERAAVSAAEQAFEEKRRSIVASQAMGPARVQATADAFVRAGADPQTAAAAAAVAARGADHLFATMPRTPQRSQTLQPELAKDRPSPDEIDTWLRRAAVVDDPSVVMEGLVRGTVTPEEIETLREVYPSYYQQVQDAVTSEVHRLSAEGVPLRYEQELVLEQLLGIVTSPTSEPAMVALAQRTFAPAPPLSPPPPAARTPQIAHLYTLEPRP